MNKFIKFTDASVRAIKPTTGQQVVHWFAGMPGFGVRVGKSGLRAFISKIGYHGKDRIITHGRYPQMTIKQAWELHEACLGRAQEGMDPVQLVNPIDKTFSLGGSVIPPLPNADGAY